MIAGAHRFPRQDEVVYGRAAFAVVLERAAAWGARRILVTSTRSLAETLALDLAKALGDLCVGVFSEIGAHSPRDSVIAGADHARRVGCDLLVALGGGSVIDATKLIQLCIWAELRESARLDDYRLAEPGSAERMAAVTPTLRMIAVPTTLSAAEFTSGAGVTDPVRQAKEAYQHALLAPRVVILDPAVTLATPHELWFSSGVRALDHAVEHLCGAQRAPYADALAAEAVPLLVGGLRACADDPNDLDARLDCQIGMWLAISGLFAGAGGGASHAIGHILGGAYRVPHGITSCVSLPAVLTWNRSHTQAQQALVSGLLGAPGRPAATAVRELVEDLGLPTTLAAIGIGRAEFPEIARRTMNDRGVRTNPRPILAADDVVEILEIAAE